MHCLRPDTMKKMIAPSCGANFSAPTADLHSKTGNLLLISQTYEKKTTKLWISEISVKRAGLNEENELRE